MSRPALVVAVLLAVLLVPSLNVTAQQQAPVPILERVAAAGSARQPALVVRPRLIALEQAARRGGDVLVALPGFDVVGRLSHFESQAGGFFAAGPITSASTPGAPVEGDISFTVAGNILVGRIVLGRRLFRIGRPGDSPFHHLDEVDLTALAPDGDPISVTPERTVRSSVAEVPDSNAFVDLLVAYTPLARITLGGTGQIQAEAIAAVNNANLALANAGVVHRYRIAYLGEVSYTESGSSSTDLSRLRSTTDGYMDEIHGLRDAYDADVVSLLTEASDVCGVGYLMGPSSVNTGFNTSAFNITIAQGCANANLSLAHEIGHNIGLHHDRANASSSPSFSYAYGYAVPGFARTVMAYACTTGGSCPRRTVFSSPNVPFPGSGVVAGTATEDNARAMNLTSVPAANFRNSACTYNLSTNSVVVGPSGGTGTVAVTTSSGCAWNAVSSNTSVAVITGGASSSGSSSATYSVGSSATARSTTLIVAGQTISVTQNGSATQPAFGQVDTPVQNAAGVQGAIGVTGWSLDNVGVASVQIFRNCLGFDVQTSCQTVLGNNLVYIGDAAFLDGARPDVAAAFPSYPQNTRAGWGYLMLTPLLPHVPNAEGFGGQGPLTLYAIATDIEGNKTLLGRSFNPANANFATPTSITMANDTIAKPFGAIDTPGQGQTVSGVLSNFGWVLTPDTNTAADATDILVPINGSTMTVFVDGMAASQVAYNQCRGTVGNPVPSGQYCNDDVASVFGNATPQPPTTTRTSNPTLFRNLDSARAAIGAYTFNTATLANGLHTIAWSVTDSAGRTEGIGSRFFNVINGASGAATDMALRAAPARQLGASATLGSYPAGTEGVWGRTGFDLGLAWMRLRANTTRAYTVHLPELGRLELWLGAPVDAGYLVAGGALQPLPVGSSLAGAHFAWMPPPGYAGAYELAFLRNGERITVSVTVGRRLRLK